MVCSVYAHICSVHYEGGEKNPKSVYGSYRQRRRIARLFLDGVSLNPPFVLFLRAVSSRLNSYALRQPHISLSVSGSGERIRFPTVGDPFNFP